MADGAQKIVELTNTLADIKKNIQNKYDKVMGRIEDLQKKRDEIENTTNQSPNWIEKKKKSIQKKIDDLLVNLEDWLIQQSEKAQAWLDEVKADITNMIANLLLSMAKAFT